MAAPPENINLRLNTVIYLQDQGRAVRFRPRTYFDFQSPIWTISVQPVSRFVSGPEPDKLRDMRILIPILLVAAAGLSATAKERPWQDAQVVKVEQSEIQIEQDLFRSSAPSGAVGQPLPTGTETRKKKIFTYQFKTDQGSYTAKVEKKPVEGIEQGAKARIAVQKDVLYVEMPGGKERKLELVKPE